MDISDLITIEGIKNYSNEYNDFVKELQDEEVTPSLFSDEDGDVDSSDAVLFVVDGHCLKKLDMILLNIIASFISVLIALESALLGYTFLLLFNKLPI